MDFTVIKRAGLSQLEFARLTGVSRVTTNMWVGGKMHPHRYITSRIKQVVDALESAVVAKQLPLSESVAPTKRLSAIKAAVLASARRLKDEALTV